jgi:hypothetical protein
MAPDPSPCHHRDRPGPVDKRRHCFGPRYWTDLIPLFAIVLACGLDWAYEHSRVLATGFALTIVCSIGVQAIGAFCFPGGWNVTPAKWSISQLTVGLP